MNHDSQKTFNHNRTEAIAARCPLLTHSPEHDKRHRRLGQSIVLLEVVLHGLRKERDVGDLIVDLLLRLRIHVIAKAQGPQVLVCHDRGARHHMGKERLPQIYVELFLTEALYKLKKI